MRAPARGFSLRLVETYYIAYPHGLCLNPGSFRSRRPRRPPSTAQARLRTLPWSSTSRLALPRRPADSAPKTRRPAKTQNLNSRFFFFKARPQHYAICSAKNALLCGSPSRPHQPGGSRILRAKCFDITRRAVDAIAEHQPALLRCDELSTALLHHYFYRCRVLAAQKKWRERTQRRRKRLARPATSRRVVGGVRRAGADGL